MTVKKIEVIIIPNTLFIYTDKERALSLPNVHGIQIKYMIDYISKSLLIVPDKQIQDFIFLMDSSDENVCIEENAYL